MLEKFSVGCGFSCKSAFSCKFEEIFSRGIKRTESIWNKSLACFTSYDTEMYLFGTSEIILWQKQTFENSQILIFFGKKYFKRSKMTIKESFNSKKYIRSVILAYLVFFSNLQETALLQEKSASRKEVKVIF